MQINEENQDKNKQITKKTKNIKTDNNLTIFLKLSIG